VAFNDCLQVFRIVAMAAVISGSKSAWDTWDLITFKNEGTTFEMNGTTLLASQNTLILILTIMELDFMSIH
jgi:hypothetical protein